MASSSIPHLDVNDTTWEPLPGFGHQSVFYRAADGKQIAGTFKESGTHRMVMPFAEFVYVIAGSVTMTNHDLDETFTASAGHTFWVSQGTDVTWAMSDDFHDVTVLTSDSPIDQ